MPTDDFSPIADRWGTDFLVFDAGRAQHVTLTDMLERFLRTARDIARKPILVTDKDAVVSWFACEELRLSGGFWVARDLDLPLEERHFDALSGYRIENVEDLWSPPDELRARLPAFDQPTTGGSNTVFLDVYSRERAVSETRIGALAEFVVGSLSSTRLERWGHQEPLTAFWDPAEMTRSLRREMPVTSVHRAEGEGRVMATTSVARTRSGLLEHTRIMLDLHATEGLLNEAGIRRFAGGDRLHRTLEGLVERFNPTVAMVSLADLDRGEMGLGQRIRPRIPDRPTAILIGPRAVRDLRLDLAQLQQQHDLVQVGLTRAPSAILRLSGPDPLWHQFLSFAWDLDQERLASALALEIPMLREDRHA